MTSGNAHRKTVLVTGGCGYLGSRLIRDLAADDRLGRPRIRILDNLQGGRHEALLDLPAESEFEFVEGDLLDPSTLRLALAGVDSVIHLAAVVRTPFSFENAVWLEQVNHWGTAHLVEACLEAEVPRVLLASSCAVYGPGGAFTEEACCRPMGPYSQSKRRAEQVVLAAAERGLEPTVVRLALLYGFAPVMRFDAVANRLAYLAGVGRALTIYGDGGQRRPLLHVDDASDAIRFLLVSPPSGTAPTVNVVAENASVLEIASAIRAVRPEVELRFTDLDIRAHLSLQVDGRKLEAMGWRSRKSLATGTVELLSRFRGLRSSPRGDLIEEL